MLFSFSLSVSLLCSLSTKFIRLSYLFTLGLIVGASNSLILNPFVYFYISSFPPPKLLSVGDAISSSGSSVIYLKLAMS